MKKNKFASLMGIIWGLIIVAVIVVTASVFRDYKYPTELQVFAKAIQDQDYQSVYHDYKRNEAMGYKVKNCAEYDMVGATVEYIEAASLYRVYLEKNDTRADACFQKNAAG